jgi:hypothetical protein
MDDDRYLALNECTDTTLGITYDLDVFYLCMFRQMFRKQSSKFGLINGGGKAGRLSSKGIGCIAM